jgi:hypothetical protein
VLRVISYSKRKQHKNTNNSLKGFPVITSFGAEDLETFIGNLSVTVVVVGSILVLLLVAIAASIAKSRKKKTQALKLPLFIAIMVVVLGTTFTISGGTVYLNLKSATGGPVHWHADFEVWACGNEVELRDPTGFLSNKIGTATYHEHDDKRIHVEGVPIDLPYDYSLGKFFNVVGGGISKDTLIVPLNDNGKYFEDHPEETDGDGNPKQAPEQLDTFIHEAEGKVASFVNGEWCGGQPSELQVFDYKFDAATKTYKQTKIADPANFMPAHESQVPNGDCIIVEFGPARDRTDKLCKQYGVRDADRCLDFGVPPKDRERVCDIREVR